MKKTPEQIVNEIQELCAALGWNIGMNESSREIRGLVIGQTKYVEGILDQLDESDEYAIYSPGESSDPDVH